MRLPPEVLCQILMFHAWIEGYQLKSALTSTHVCRQWRQVGLDCPEMWSYIDCNQCHSVSWMATMIDRSCAVPLSLVIPKGMVIPSGMVDLIDHNMRRFKWLSLAIQGIDNDVFFNLFSQPVPLLDSLTFSSESWSPNSAFPPKFLGGNSPNLRYIKLSTNCCIPWGSGLFTNLVALDIARSAERPNDPNAPPLELLLSALREMRGLETLLLRNCLPRPTPSTMAHIRVNLPNLRRLWVVGLLRSSTCFLRQLTVNSTAALLLNLARPNVVKDDVDEFLVVLSSSICANPTQVFHFTWRSSSHKFWVCAWSGRKGKWFRTIKNANIKISFKLPRSSDMSPLDLARTCYATFMSPQLRIFSIFGDGIAGWNAQTWCELARITPGLWKVIVGEVSLSIELCKALCPPDGQDLVLEKCCFPALSYLEILAPYDCLMPTQDGGGSSLSVVLSSSLAMRAAIGCSTPELVFCTIEGEFPEGWSEPFTDAIPGIVVRGKVVSQRYLDPDSLP
ncbi:hypothetical protein BD779DRAFT_1547513 [Infundibulicybe gibba]|nr:hypothetical protein BD779DRAFT_1547513 [Infundibulicybe gibba]